MSPHGSGTSRAGIGNSSISALQLNGGGNYNCPWAFVLWVPSTWTAHWFPLTWKVYKDFQVTLGVGLHLWSLLGISKVGRDGQSQVDLFHSGSVLNIVCSMIVSIGSTFNVDFIFPCSVYLYVVFCYWTWLGLFCFLASVFYNQFYYNIWTKWYRNA